MGNFVNKTDCCGCGACAQVCPKACIAMQADGEGFLYPAVDEKICVSCGRCQRVCPVIQSKEKQGSSPLAVYAAYAKDGAIRERSSSGGIFSVLAEWVLRQGGVVFGAAFAEDFSVCHIRVDSVEDMEKLRGSKYLQSRIEQTYLEAKAALSAGKWVLFSGVSCQIAGLRTFLGADNEHLIMLEVLCHGVPSPKLWKSYYRYCEEKNESLLEAASFRDKRLGWHHYEIRLDFKNSKVQRTTHGSDVYMNMFLSDICLRPSCHDCRFREGRSGADITLGDAWGIEKWMPEMDDDRGTSVVLINSTKGNHLWDMLQGEQCVRNADFETVVAHNMVYKKSVKPHPNRTRFFKALESGTEIEKLVRLVPKPLYRKILSFAKRIVKRMLHR